MFIDLAGQSGGGSKSIPIINSIPSEGINPGVHYSLGGITTDPNIVNINLPEDHETVDYEWMVSFTIGATVPSTITFASYIIFPETPSWEENKYYEISMKYNVRDDCWFAVVQSWDAAIE